MLRINQIFQLPELKNNTILYNIGKFPQLRHEVISTVLPIIETWSGQKLSKKVIIYGIRRYFRGAWLSMHVDRLPTHILSSILQVTLTKSRGILNYSIVVSVVKMHTLQVLL